MSKFKDVIAYCMFFAIGFVPFGPINALWAEVGLFERNPEGKGIGALIGAAYNIANIVPLLYLVLVRYKKISDLFTANVLYALAIVDMIGVSLLWNWTSNSHSIGIMIFSFISGVVGCTANIVVFNFAARYHKIYISALSSGMSLSGIFGALMALAQEGGGSEAPLFSISTYFIVFACVMGFSFPSFWAVTRPMFVEEYGDSSWSSDSDYNVPLIDEEEKQSKRIPISQQVRHWGRLVANSHSPLLSILLTSFMNYFTLPGLIPYLVGNYAYRTVYVIVSLSFANLFGRMVCGISNVRRFVRSPYLLVLFQLICFVYLIFVAIFTSYFTSSLSGIALLLTMCAIFSFLNGMIMTTSYLVLDNVGSDKNLVIRWLGLITQVGSLSGSFIVNSLVSANVFN